MDYHRDRRKIDPSRAGVLGDGTPNDNDRVEIGPTQLAFREWEAAGLVLPVRQAPAAPGSCPDRGLSLLQ